MAARNLADRSVMETIIAVFCFLLGGLNEKTYEIFPGTFMFVSLIMLAGVVLRVMGISRLKNEQGDPRVAWALLFGGAILMASAWGGLTAVV